MIRADIALKACQALESGKWIDTPNLVRLVGAPKDEYTFVRSTLIALYKRGVLNRSGKGKFRWLLARKDYDRTNPLKTKPRDASEAVKVDTGLTGERYFDTSGLPWIKVNGKTTYEYRTQLKEAGCAWHESTLGRFWRTQQSNVSKLKGLIDNYDALLAELNGSQVEAIDETLDELPKVQGKDFGPVVEKLLKQLNDLEDEVAKLHRARKVEITVKHIDGKSVVLEGRTHPIFEQVMFHINCGDNVMLVGPKGCGKTVLAEQVSKALKRDYGMISLSGGVTESKLFGRVVPNVNTGKNEYHSTMFVELFESGGVFLLDEVDAADPNVLLSINSALANGILALDRPKTPLAKRHAKFVCLAAANTWGNGADRQYVGRNQQDSAFTERFVQIAMDYDTTLELALCPGGESMVEQLHKYREAVIANRLERTISTRFITRAFNWLQAGKDQTYIDQMLFSGWRADEIRKVKGL